MKPLPPIQILIVEDEFITLDLLRDALLDLGYEIAGDAMNVEEAKNILATRPVDLAILDINLRGKNSGIDLGRLINEQYKIPFIYLTAYDDPTTIALAVDTNPYAYLIKPFTPAAIHAALKVAVARDNARGGKEEDFLILRENTTFFKVRASDINYVEAFRNYLEVHTSSGKRLIRGTLKDLEERLPTDLFFQPHRSFLVNANAVTAYRNGELQLAETRIPVSKRGHKVVTRFFAQRDVPR